MDNLKLSVLVEFLVGTFTFNIVIEFILQPILFVLILMQMEAKKRTESAKKIVDGVVGGIGILILVLTVKSAFDAIDDLVVVDIVISFLLPIVLSVLYLPVAYGFAVYAKYDTLFVRMESKEPKDKKIKFKRRLKIIRLCKLSYKKVYKFIYEYEPKLYVNMSDIEFEHIINVFRGTTEHTYIAAIKHNGKYYVSRELSIDSKFVFNSFRVDKGGIFKNSNKELRKEIALQIQNETPYRNTDYKDGYSYRSVSLRRLFSFSRGSFFKRIKIAIFISNEIEKGAESINLPFSNDVKEQSDDVTIKLMRKLKWDNIWPAFVSLLAYFLIFFLASFMPDNLKVDFDIVAFVFAVTNYLLMVIKKKSPLYKLKIYRRIVGVQNWLAFNGLLEIIVFFISLYIACILQSVDISSSIISKLGIAFIFFDALISLVQREQ